MPTTLSNVLTSIVCLSSALHAHGAVITKRQSPEQAAQLSSQIAQLSSMNAPYLEKDKAYMASMYAIISSQAAAMGIAYTMPTDVAAALSTGPAIVQKQKVDDDDDDDEDDDCPPGGSTQMPSAQATSAQNEAVPSLSPAQTTPVPDTPKSDTSAAPSSTTNLLSNFGLQNKAVQHSDTKAAPEFAVQSLSSQGPSSETGAGQTQQTQAQQPQVQPTSPPAASAPSSVPPTVASTATAPAASSGGGSGGSNPCTAYVPGGTCSSTEITFYNPTVMNATTKQMGPSLGSCGNLLSDTDETFAFSLSIMLGISAGGNTNLNPMCGKVISITGPAGTFDATLQDSCEACSTDNHIDLPAEFWKKVTGMNPDVGRAKGFSYTWK